MICLCLPLFSLVSAYIQKNEIIYSYFNERGRIIHTPLYERNPKSEEVTESFSELVKNPPTPRVILDYRIQPESQESRDFAERDPSF